MISSIATIMAVVLIYKLIQLLFIPSAVHPMITVMPTSTVTTTPTTTPTSIDIVVDTDQDIQLTSIDGFEAEPAECVICFEDLNPAYGTIADLSCRHNFHKACIFHWFNSTTDYTCPYCRQIPILPINLKRYDPMTDVMTTSRYPEVFHNHVS